MSSAALAPPSESAAMASWATGEIRSCSTRAASPSATTSAGSTAKPASSRSNTRRLSSHSVRSVTVHARRIDRDQHIAAGNAGEHMAGHVRLEKAREPPVERALARRRAGQHVKRHVLSAADALDPRFPRGKAIRRRDALERQQRRHQRRGRKHAAKLEMHRHGGVAAKPEAALLLGQRDHQPAHFGGELPGVAARRPELVGRECLLGAVAQFLESSITAPTPSVRAAFRACARQ